MFAFYACKEERNLPITQLQDHYVQVSSSDGPLVQKQLTWIAKGLAGISHQNPSVKNIIHDLVSSTDFFTESNTNLDQELSTAFGYDYDQEVNQWLQQEQPGNDYDQAFFFDIDVDSCLGKVSVRIPTDDQTKLHVVTPDNPLAAAATTLGYYLNAVGTIDSLIVTEDNIDSVYLWIVGVENDCTVAIDSCGDGILGDTEDCETCPEDCSTPYPDFDVQQPAFKLSLKQFHTLTDQKNGSGHPADQYQESHFQSRYEIYLSYGVYETNDYTTFTGAWDEIFWWTDPQNGKAKPKAKGKAELIGKYRSWRKGARITRENLANGNKNKGSHFLDNVNMTLADTIQPHKDNFFFCVFEKDYFAGVLGARNDNDIWSNSWSYSYVQGQNGTIPSSALPSGFDGTDNWRFVEISLIGDEPGPPFIAAGPNEWLYFADLGGEAEAIFKLERI